MNRQVEYFVEYVRALISVEEPIIDLTLHYNAGTGVKNGQT